MSRSARLIDPTVAWSRNLTEMSWRTPMMTRDESTTIASASSRSHTRPLT